MSVGHLSEYEGRFQRYLLICSIWVAMQEFFFAMLKQIKNYMHQWLLILIKVKYEGCVFKAAVDYYLKYLSAILNFLNTKRWRDGKISKDSNINLSNFDNLQTLELIFDLFQSLAVFIYTLEQFMWLHYITVQPFLIDVYTVDGDPVIWCWTSRSRWPLPFEMDVHYNARRVSLKKMCLCSR